MRKLLSLGGNELLLIGHRGCKYPGFNQNTIRAFKKVASEGVPAIEFDVQRCRDGELVVVHNLDLREVSNGEGRVSATDAKEIKRLFAGDPQRGKDRIPTLAEVFDFFAALEPDSRPRIHMELKGGGTGKPAGELFNRYIESGKLSLSDILASSFNWQELTSIRAVLPDISIALLDGAIRRELLIKKVGAVAQSYFEKLFFYGAENYMLPRFDTLADNQAHVIRNCSNVELARLIVKEINDCLNGCSYTDALLDTACSMKAVSVNLWYKTVTAEFIDKAHGRGLKVFVFTVNDPDDIRAVAEMGVDGLFTDYYAEARRLLK